MDAILIASNQAVVAPMPARPATRALRILLADDSPLDRRIIQELLRRLGAVADVAADGNEAADAASDKPYDLVLMDILMPHLDGLEAAKRIIARLPPGKAPRIVAITGDPLLASPERCRQAGMAAYLAKPVRPEQLKAILDAAAEARRP
ncbi:MAG: response regulator [bacterium]